MPDFLELVERGKQGRLKLYVGFAAGVGKTYRMLEEAHALKDRGVDAVIAFVETHARAETQALVAGLPFVPRRVFSYRGVDIEELDLEAVLARKPQVAFVDELAHTNAPGCVNKKRYQDVEALLTAGIHVIAAVNIQHLESLNDVVSRATGVAVRETVPDAFFARADQIVNLDLSVEDLHDRLRAGKIYAPEKIESALTGFFQRDHLSTLRELALREVAERLDRSPRTPTAHERPRTAGRVMVALSSFPPRARMLLRRGTRIAGRLNTDWFVVYVETPREAPNRIDAEAQRHLLANLELARELGAEVKRVQAADPVKGLIDFARSHAVGMVLVGRSRLPRWKQWLGLSHDQRMVREAEGLDVLVVAFDDPEGSNP